MKTIQELENDLIGRMSTKDLIKFANYSEKKLESFFDKSKVILDSDLV